MPRIDDSRFARARDICEEYGISEKTLHRWVHRDGCPSYQVEAGADHRFDRREVAAHREGRDPASVRIEPGELVVSVRRFAELLHVHRQTAYRWLGQYRHFPRDTSGDQTTIDVGEALDWMRVTG